MKYLIILILSTCAFGAFGKNTEIKPRPDDGKPKVARSAHKPFPPHWGRPPAIQTKDFKKLPLNFGMGSSTLAKWIIDNVKKDQAKPVRPERPKPSPEVQKKINEIKTKEKELKLERDKLKKELKGKSKKDVMELIKAFRETNKEKYQAFKDARKSLIEDIRSKRQTGPNRE